MPLVLLVALVLALCAGILTALAARGRVPLWYAVACLTAWALLRTWPIG